MAKPHFAPAVKVVVTPHRFPNLDPETEVLKPLGADLIPAQDPEELERLLPEADALLVVNSRIDARRIALMARCRAIVRYGIGVDSVDVAAASKAGIPVGNVTDASTTEVADHAVSLALALLRRLPKAEAAVREGQWSIAPLRGARRLSTLTAGIVGVGQIGRAIATRFAAFGMDVIGHDPFASDAPVQTVQLEDLLSRSDVISLHLPLNDQTTGLISAGRLRSLRSGAILVNVSRGGLVDEDALVDALQAGALGGAALDVFATEPLAADSRLRSAPNVILTAHSAWYSEEAAHDLQRKAAEQVARAFQGAHLTPIVNPEVYNR